MNRIHLPGRALLLAAAFFLAAGTAVGQPIQLSLDGPSLDRWMYPFNGSPGAKFDASIFGGVTDPEVGFDPGFDNRDGQMVMGFDTSPTVPVGMGAASYHVAAATVKVIIKSDLAFAYDPTQDSWTTWLPSSDPSFEPDGDAGRPVEIFGAGFRNGFTALTFAENGPFCNGCSCLPPDTCKAVRNVYPVDAAAGCAFGDASNNVDGMFDPVPFAVGMISGLTPGQIVPQGAEMTFTLDVANPCVAEYLAGALDEGRLDLVIASIFAASQQQSGTFPKVYCKEDPLAMLGIVHAAQLEMTVTIGSTTGDLNGDGVVSVADLLILLTEWGPCPSPCPPACAPDFNGDCNVGTADFLTLLVNWSL